MEKYKRINVNVYVFQNFLLEKRIKKGYIFKGLKKINLKLKRAQGGEG